MKAIRTAAAGQYDTAIRAAFTRALMGTKERTRLTGRVFHALCTSAGIVRL